MHVSTGPSASTTFITTNHLIPHIVHRRIILRAKFLQRAGMENLMDRLARAEEEMAYLRRKLRKEETRGEEYTSTGKAPNVRNRASIL